MIKLDPEIGKAVIDVLKSNGTLFVVMALVCYMLYDKLNRVEEKYQKQIEMLWEEVRACNDNQRDILLNQIEKTMRFWTNMGTDLMNKNECSKWDT